MNVLDINFPKTIFFSIYDVKWVVRFFLKNRVFPKSESLKVRLVVNINLVMNKKTNFSTTSPARAHRLARTLHSVTIQFNYVKPTTTTIEPPAHHQANTPRLWKTHRCAAAIESETTGARVKAHLNFPFPHPKRSHVRGEQYSPPLSSQLIFAGASFCAW